MSCTSQGDRIVLLDLASEQFFTLDDVGARIWELLGRTLTVDEITTELVRVYDAPVPTIREDVAAFLGGLMRDGLVCPA